MNVSPVTARNLRVAGTQVFFEGTTDNNFIGFEPWVTDGTTAGTHLLSDILPGPQGSLDTVYNGEGFTTFGNRVLFLANDGVHGREMWISDGTAAGTRMVRDVVPGARGPWDHSYAYITTLGNRAFFAAYDGDHGWELWVTDGTEAGTTLFADLVPGPESSSPALFVASGNQIFFSASYDYPVGPQLWVTDGTVGGTHAIGGTEKFGLGDFWSGFWPIGGKVYFSGVTALSGAEPWVTDGTDGGTRRIANLAADGPPSSTPNMLTPTTSNLLFFYATEGILSPTSNIAEASLWRSDGTAAGTFKLLEAGQHPATLTAAGPYVFFESQDNQSHLMVSDGTANGTKPAADFLRRFGPSPFGPFYPCGDTLFATVFDLGTYDSSLWKTTAAPDAPAVRLGAHNPSGLIEVAGHYLFRAEGPGGYYNSALWTTDGTPEGTYAIVPNFGDTGSTRPLNLVNAGGTVFFFNTLRDENTKLWKSDGTADGTTIVKELPAASSYVTEIKAAGRRVFFLAGGALWTSDGTDAGTIELATVTFSVTSNEHLVVAGNRIVFDQYDPANGSVLWGSDGTPAGTKVLQKLGQLDPGPVSINGTVYYSGIDDLHGVEVWATDGSVEGTRLLADVNPGPASSNPFGFAKCGNLLYFSAYTDATGTELWAIPLTTPQLSIADTRTAEGDSGTTPARFTVSLDPAAKQTVTVDYSTSDGTAVAGQDYDAASGTLRFAPGETSKTVDVAVRGDVVPENNETFFVTLRNASGAGILKSEGTGIIDDDDQIADLSVASQFTQDGAGIRDGVSVSNSGPRSATDVAVKLTNTPFSYGQYCTTCPIPEIAAGTSSVIGVGFQQAGQQIYLSATATARQRDPQVPNNTATWTVNDNRSMVMSPAYLVPGATATVSVWTFMPAPAVTSSDPSVVSVQPTITAVTSGFGTFTVTALKTGTSTISISGDLSPLLITVAAAGTQPRWPGGLSIGTNEEVTTFERPVTVNVTPSGTAPVSGATATGTVVVAANGQELARQNVSGPATIAIPVYLPAVGSIPFTVTYIGDSNFLSQTANENVYVYPGNATLTGDLEPEPGAPGTLSLTIRATGSPAAAPTGILSVISGGVEIAKLPLVAHGNGESQATTTLTHLPASPALTVNYSGDAFYLQGSQQLRWAARPHTVRH